jgi:hypothetical protein
MSPETAAALDPRIAVPPDPESPLLDAMLADYPGGPEIRDRLRERDRPSVRSRP